MTSRECNGGEADLPALSPEPIAYTPQTLEGATMVETVHPVKLTLGNLAEEWYQPSVEVQSLILEYVAEVLEKNVEGAEVELIGVKECDASFAFLLRVTVDWSSDVAVFALSYILKIIRDDLAGQLRNILQTYDRTPLDTNPYANVELSAGAFNWVDVNRSTAPSICAVASGSTTRDIPVVVDSESLPDPEQSLEETHRKPITGSGYDISGVRSGQGIEFHNAAEVSIEDTDFKEEFCNAIKDHLVDTVYLSTLYTIDDVNCYNFTFEPSHSLLSGRQLDDETSQSGTLKAEFVSAARYSWADKEVEIRRLEEFGGLIEDSINRDGGVRVKRKLEDRGIVALKEAEVLAYETSAPVSYKALTMPRNEAEILAPPPVAPTVTGMILIPTIGVVLLLLAGLLFYKGTKGKQPSKKEKAQARGPLEVVRNQANIELPQFYTSSARIFSLAGGVSIKSNDCSPTNASSNGGNCIRPEITAEAANDLEGGIVGLREIWRSGGIVASGENAAQKNSFEERMQSKSRKMALEKNGEIKDEDAARKDTIEVQIQAKSRLAGLEQIDEIEEPRNPFEANRHRKWRSVGSDKNASRLEAIGHRKRRPITPDENALPKKASKEREKRRPVPKNAPKERMQAKSRPMSSDKNAARKNAFEKRIQAKSRSMAANDIHAARKNAFEERIKAKSRLMAAGDAPRLKANQAVLRASVPTSSTVKGQAARRASRNPQGRPPSSFDNLLERKMRLATQKDPGISAPLTQLTKGQTKQKASQGVRAQANNRSMTFGKRKVSQVL